MSDNHGFKDSRKTARFQVDSINEKKSLILAPLLLAGFSSVVIQTALLREILSVCQGTELTVGFALAAWLGAGALGSRMASQLRGRPASADWFPLALLAMSAVAVPGLLAIRGFKLVAGYLPGQAVSLGHTALLAAIATAPPGLAAGAVFSFGAGWLESGKSERPAGSAYWAEAAGYVLGGVAYTLWAQLLPGISATAAAAAMVSVAGLCAAKQRGIRTASAAAIPVFFLVAMLGPRWEILTQQWLFPGSAVAATAESHYGRTVAAGAAGQTTVYHNGWPVFSAPAALSIEQEETAALGLLYADQPRCVLVIGGAGLLPLLLNQDIDSVTYAEIDPQLINAVGDLLPKAAGVPPSRTALARVQTDARRFIERTHQRFDVIFIGTPYFANLASNRYYTLEFMAAARKRLTPGGVLAASLPGSETARSRDKAGFDASIENTLAAAFDYYLVIRGGHDIYMGRNSGPLPTVTEIENRFLARHLRMPSLTLSHLQHRLESGNAIPVTGTAGATPVRINRDGNPGALLPGLLLWQAALSPATVRAYRILSGIPPWAWLTAATALLWLRKRHYGTAFSAGAAAMGMQMLCLWGVQMSQGELYHWIALANALFMAGTAAGAFAAVRMNCNPERGVLLSDAAFSIWGCLFLLVTAVVPLPGWGYLIGSAISGAMLGAEFTLLAADRASASGQGEGRIAGRLYAADMLGGAVAALWIGTLAIPAWGFLHSAGAVAGMKLLSLPWWLLRIFKQNHS